MRRKDCDLREASSQLRREPGTVSKASKLQEAKKHVVLSHGDFEGCACFIGSSRSTVFSPLKGEF